MRTSRPWLLLYLLLVCLSSRLTVFGLPSITMDPFEAVNTVGSSHSVTATVAENGQPVAGLELVFDVVTGPNAAAVVPVSIYTDAAGQATFTYQGGGDSGTDEIQARDPFSLAFGVAFKRWEYPRLTLAPLNTSASVLRNHTVVATLKDHLEQPIAGVPLDLFVVTGPHAGVGESGALTDNQGQVTLTYRGEKTGQDEIQARAPALLGGVFAQALHSWVFPDLDLNQDTDVNLVTTSHTVKATMLDHVGVPFVGFPLDFRVASGPNSGASAAGVLTDANGQAEFTYTSDGENGTDEIQVTAYVPGTDPKVPVDFAVVFKQWVLPTLTLDPAAAENYVGTRHTVKAVVWDHLGQPVENAVVEFYVSGVNSTGFIYVTTDAGGEAQFIYTGSLTPGKDTVQATVDSINGIRTFSNFVLVEKTWVADELPPQCSAAGIALDGQGRQFVAIDSEDRESGLSTLSIVSSENVNVEAPAFTPGVQTLTVRLVQADPFQAAAAVIEFVDQGGNSTRCEAAIPAAVPVPLDVKPRSCPNPLNLAGEGGYPVAILGTADFDVRCIDLSTIRLAGIAPRKSSFADVAAPFEPLTGRVLPTDCTKAGPDRVLDLMLHFDNQELTRALAPGANNNVLTIVLTAKLLPSCGSTYVAGEDVIVLVPPK